MDRFVGVTRAQALQGRRAKAAAAAATPTPTIPAPASTAPAPPSPQAEPDKAEKRSLPEVELWYKKKYGPLTIPEYGACAGAAGLVGLLIRNAVRRKAGL